MKTSLKLIFVLLVSSISLATQPPLGSEDVELLDLVLMHNHARASARLCGNNRMPAARELIWNKKLSDAAQKHAQDMASKQFLSHIGSDQSNFSQRAKAQDYTVLYLAENIGQGYDSASAIFSKWLSSAPHCRNIMHGNYSDIGASNVDDVWVVMYGRE